MTKKMSALERSLQEMKNALEGKPNGVITNSVKFYPVPSYSAEDIKTLRSKLGLIQGDFALILAVSTRTVQAWEAGRSHPSPSNRRLLQLIQ